MVMVAAQDTRVGKKAKAIENSLVRELTRIYKDQIQPHFGFLTIDETRKHVNDIVTNIIRSKVEEAYRYGSVAVAQFLKEPFIFTSDEDHVNIIILSEDLENQFWTTVGKLDNRSTEHIVVDNELEQLKPYNDSAAIIGISSFIAYYAVNNGIMSKTVQMKDSIVGLSQEQILQRFGRNALLKLQDRVISHQGKFPIIFVYLTASDSRVDPEFCAPLHRQEFDIDASNIPTPPLHRHCRCVIIPKNILTNEFLI